MPALIKANATLTAGNPQLVNYNINTSADGGLSITAEFVALSRSVASSYGLFKIGSNLHPAIAVKADVIGALQNYNSQGLPILTGVEIVTASGLATISLNYTGEAIPTAGTNADGTPIITQEITTSTDLRSFSGSYTDTASGKIRNATFDYYATTVTSENDNPVPVSPSGPFNVRGIYSYEIQSIATTQNVISTRTYRNNLGQYKTTNTVTVIYINKG